MFGSIVETLKVFKVLFTNTLACDDSHEFPVEFYNFRIVLDVAETQIINYVLVFLFEYGSVLGCQDFVNRDYGHVKS